MPLVMVIINSTPVSPRIVPDFTVELASFCSVLQCQHNQIDLWSKLLRGGWMSQEESNDVSDR